MTPEQWQQVIQRTFDRVQEVTATKGVEYRKSDDQLDNFYRQAREVGITPLQVWRVFFQKHADAVTAFTRDPSRKTSEPIEGRIDDAIVYLLLLKGLVDELPAQGITHIEIKADTEAFRDGIRKAFDAEMGRGGLDSLRSTPMNEALAEERERFEPGVMFEKIVEMGEGPSHRSVTTRTTLFPGYSIGDDDDGS